MSPGENGAQREGGSSGSEPAAKAGRADVERFVQVAKAKAEWEQTVDLIDDPIALDPDRWVAA